MKTCLRRLLSVFALSCLASSALAKSHSYQAAPLATLAPEPPPLPTEITPKVDFALPPSASLQPFLDTHLAKVLTPLGVSAFNQPELIADLKAVYADAAASATAAHRPSFQYAQAVCNALANAMSERQAAVNALHGSLTTRGSEAAQPRGGAPETDTKNRLDDNLFVTSQLNAWNTRAEVLRKSIIAMNLRERDVERQEGGWPSPPPAPSPSPATAAVAATAPDPVVGQWNLKGTTSLVLTPDGGITGGRHGSWVYTCTTNAGRNYELHWLPPKDWVDYLVLTADGKGLNGKTKGDQPIAAYRQ